MSLDTWLVFLTACFVLSLIPGPSVFVVVSQSISFGKKNALVCISGELFGGVCLMILSLLGVGAIVSGSPVVFEVIKWLGVVYLVYLGMASIRAAFQPSAISHKKEIVNKRSFSAGFWVSAFNPKSLVFYLAFFTQFVTLEEPLLIQYAILVLTAVATAFVVLSAYALGAAYLTKYISNTSSRRRFSGVSGCLYLCGAVFVATNR